MNFNKTSFINNNLPLVILILCSVIIFLNQLYRVDANDLSRWKGGGMGMFSTADNPSTRIVDVVLTGSDNQQYYVKKKGLNNLAQFYRSEPTEENFIRLCQKLMNKSFLKTPHYLDVGAVVYPVAELSTNASEDKLIQLQAISLSGWKVYLDETSQLRFEALHQIELKAGENGC